MILALLLVAAQAPDFQSGVTLVRLDVRVARAGRPVTDLQAADFTVRDEGRPQTLRHLSAEPMDLDLVLLLDTSGSMRPALAELARNASLALEKLRTGDRVAILTFGGETAARLPWTGDWGAARRVLEQLPAQRGGSTTGISRALVAAAELFRTSPRESRRAILIVTDNRSTEPSRAEAGAIRAALAAEALVEAIVVPTAGPLYLSDSVARSLGRNAEDVRRIAERSGGEWREASEVPATLGAAVERMRSGYALYYTPPASVPGTYRRVRVTVRGARSEVRHRPGYVAR